uniref:RNA helicase n=1 Tax=Clastoptera arizonana TaxID=38151 RepID=A0A1B6CUG5_9HEMI
MNEKKMAQIAHNFNSKHRSDDVILRENVNFQSYGFSNPVAKGLEDAGFVKPSPIQFKSISEGLIGFDLIIESKSGTGKTLVFTLVLLETVDFSVNSLQAIVLAPTREVADQNYEVMMTIGKNIKGLKVERFIGGLPVKNDVERLKNCNIAIGSPGRLVHLLKGQSLIYVTHIVLDEADILMESFKNEIRSLLSECSYWRQVIACSATYTPEALTWIKKYMNDSAKHIQTSSDKQPCLLGIRQYMCIIPEDGNSARICKTKQNLLLDLLSKTKFTQCFIFTKYQLRATSLSNVLQSAGHSSIWLNGKQPQELRFEILNKFKKLNYRILVSTDLVARGIDIENIDLVINYDLPFDISTYFHRMGRAGRFGSNGMVISMVSDGQELSKFQNTIRPENRSSIYILQPNQISIDLLTCDTFDFKTIENITEECNKTDTSTKKRGTDVCLLEINKIGEEDGNNISNSGKIKASLNAFNEKKDSDRNFHIYCKCQKLIINISDIEESTNDFCVNTDQPLNKVKLPLCTPFVIVKDKVIPFMNINDFEGYKSGISSETIKKIKAVDNLNTLQKQQISQDLSNFVTQYQGKNEHNTKILESVAVKYSAICKKEEMYLKLSGFISEHSLESLDFDNIYNLIDEIKVPETEVTLLKMNTCKYKKLHVNVINLGEMNSFLYKEQKQCAKKIPILNCSSFSTKLPNPSFKNILEYLGSTNTDCGMENRSLFKEETSSLNISDYSLQKHSAHCSETMPLNGKNPPLNPKNPYTVENQKNGGCSILNKDMHTKNHCIKGTKTVQDSNKYNEFPLEKLIKVHTDFTYPTEIHDVDKKGESNKNASLQADIHAWHHIKKHQPLGLGPKIGQDSWKNEQTKIKKDENLSKYKGECYDRYNTVQENVGYCTNCMPIENDHSKKHTDSFNYRGYFNICNSQAQKYNSFKINDSSSECCLACRYSTEYIDQKSTYTNTLRRHTSQNMYPICSKCCYSRKLLCNGDPFYRDCDSFTNETILRAIRSLRKVRRDIHFTCYPKKCRICNV